VKIKSIFQIMMELDFFVFTIFFKLEYLHNILSWYLSKRFFIELNPVSNYMNSYTKKHPIIIKIQEFHPNESKKIIFYKFINNNYKEFHDNFPRIVKSEQIMVCSLVTA
jgi:hypothetical protein